MFGHLVPQGKMQKMIAGQLQRGGGPMGKFAGGNHKWEKRSRAPLVPVLTGPKQRGDRVETRGGEKGGKE